MVSIKPSQHLENILDNIKRKQGIETKIKRVNC